MVLINAHLCIFIENKVKTSMILKRDNFGMSSVIHDQYIAPTKLKSKAKYSYQLERPRQTDLIVDIRVSSSYFHQFGEIVW